jgi:serine/threonine protein kinase
MPDFGPRWIEPRKLDTGGQALTFLVHDAADQSKIDYVAKVLNNPKPDREQRFLQEIEVTKTFDFPYVVRNVFSGKTQRSGWPYFVMPYYTLGTLEAVYDQLGTPLDRMRLFLAICEGVAYAHSRRLIHRDLKPSNIFMSTLQHPVVGDFGLCYRADENAEGRFTQSTEAVGARKYMPAEWREGRADKPKQTGDIYSLGKILYWLFQGGVYDGHEDDHVTDHPILKTRAVLENQSPQAPDRWTVAYSVAQELVSQTVRKNEAARIDSAAKLVEKVQAGIYRIETGACVLDFNLPKTCIFCGKGTYQLPPNMPFPTLDHRRRMNPEYLSQLSGFVRGSLGIGNQAGGIIPIPLVCHICGNIQYFRLDLTQDKKGENWNP